jgi:hypothetical protein
MRLNCSRYIFGTQKTRGLTVVLKTLHSELKTHNSKLMIRVTSSDFRRKLYRDVKRYTYFLRRCWASFCASACAIISAIFFWKRFCFLGFALLT